VPTRTYLELNDGAAFRPSWANRDDVRVEEVAGCPASFYRYLYTEVGRDYQWRDRLGWSDEAIRTHLAAPENSLWVMWVSHAPAGYFELREEGGGSTELAYFGLLPEFTGQRLGAHLLSVAIDRALARGATRVWLHTSTLDAPAALPNYLRRGFVPFKTVPINSPVAAVLFVKSPERCCGARRCSCAPSH
jgi:GNAT superfamily N-acetyltransferase